jgi:tetraacyldisaccharide 4'-kinase
LLDRLYARAAGHRRRWFERHPGARRRLQRPVISVGNLTVGGSGKTPMVAAIAQWLLDRGERPAILSRGYKRASAADGVTIVATNTGVHAAVDVAGDEPLMLARKLSGALVLVADDRHLAGTLAERALGATVHVLDDGFQHLPLARDVDVLMTRVGEIGSGRVLPFGRLREAPEAAARADVVVVLDTDLAGARSEAWSLGVSQVVAGRYRIDGAGGTGGAGEAGEAVKAMAVAGIAQPDRFFDLLRQAGYDVLGTIGFSDHHRFAPRDVGRIAEAARAAGTTTVLTTEKDAVRFEPLQPLPFQCRPVPMMIEIDGWDTLTALIADRLARVRGTS